MADKANVVIAKPKDIVGGIYVAPIGSTIPRTYSSTLSSDYKPLGYITEDGPSRSSENKTDPVKAWGGTKIASTREGAEATVSFNAYEYLNPNVQELIYGHDNITYDAATGELSINGDMDAIPPHATIVIDILTETAEGRIVYPDWQAKEVGEIKLSSKEPTQVEFKGDLFKGADGKHFHEYWKNSAASDDSGASFVGFDLNAPAPSGD